MPKHTPGTWNIVDDYGMYEIENKNHSIARISDYPGYDEANARLIATAPELLEALKQMVDCFNVYDLDEIDKAIEKAKATIAKAEGE